MWHVNDKDWDYTEKNKYPHIFLSLTGWPWSTEHLVCSKGHVWMNLFNSHTPWSRRCCGPHSTGEDAKAQRANGIALIKAWCLISRAHSLSWLTSQVLSTHAQSFSRVRRLETPRVPLSMEFSRQEYWSGFPLLLPGKWKEDSEDFLTQVLCIGRWILNHWATWGALGSQNF